MTINQSIDAHLETTPLDDAQKNRAKELILKYWNVIGEELVQMVDKAHSRPKTTQNNYGAYMSLLDSLTKGCKIDSPMSAVLLKLAGCDPLGLASAYKLSQGDYRQELYSKSVNNLKRKSR
jgi:hypothetical protein